MYFLLAEASSLGVQSPWTGAPDLITSSGRSSSGCFSRSIAKTCLASKCSVSICSLFSDIIFVQFLLERYKTILYAIEVKPGSRRDCARGETSSSPFPHIPLHMRQWLHIFVRLIGRVRSRLRGENCGGTKSIGRK